MMCGRYSEEALRAFFLFLRKGLQREPQADGALPVRVDWQAVWELSRKQAVTALVWDGIQAMAARVKPPQAVAQRFFAESVLVERANLRVGQVLAQATDAAASAGAVSVLLKGHAYAALYPRPLHRHPGDIDLYSATDFDRVQQAFAQRGFEPLANHQYLRYHAEWRHGGIVIENHRHPSRFASPRYDAVFVRLSHSWFPRGVVQRRVGTAAVAVPPPEFELLMGVLHFGRHLLQGGVGLRQLCDWLVLARAHRTAARWEQVAADVRAVGLYRVACLMTALTDRYLLSLPDEVRTLFPPVPQAVRWSARVMADILRDGNFGHHKPREGRLARALRWDTQRRFVRYGPLFGREAFWVWLRVLRKRLRG